MTIYDVLDTINQFIRQQRTVDSISPTQLAYVLDTIVKFSVTNENNFFLTANDQGTLSDLSLVERKLYVIIGTGITLLEGNDFTKDISSSTVVMTSGTLAVGEKYFVITSPFLATDVIALDSVLNFTLNV